MYVFSLLQHYASEIFFFSISSLPWVVLLENTSFSVVKALGFFYGTSISACVLFLCCMSVAVTRPWSIL